MGEGGGSCRPAAGTQPCPPAGRPPGVGVVPGRRRWPGAGGCPRSGGRRSGSLDARRIGSRGAPTCASLLYPRPARPTPAEPRWTPKAPTRPRSPRLSTAEPCLYLFRKRSGGGIFQHLPSGQVTPAEDGRTCRPGGAHESAGRRQAPAPLCEREPGRAGLCGQRHARDPARRLCRWLRAS